MEDMLKKNVILTFKESAC